MSGNSFEGFGGGHGRNFQPTAEIWDLVREMDEGASVAAPEEAIVGAEEATPEAGEVVSVEGREEGLSEAVEAVPEEVKREDGRKVLEVVESEEDKMWNEFKETLAKIREGQEERAKAKLERNRAAKRFFRRALAVVAASFLTAPVVASGTSTASVFDGAVDIELEKVQKEKEGEVKVEEEKAEEAETTASVFDGAVDIELEKVQKEKEDEEWEATLATVEEADISDYEVDAGMSWEEFVNWTNELEENAPFAITTRAEAEQYRVDEDGALHLTNRTNNGGQIVRG